MPAPATRTTTSSSRATGSGRSSMCSCSGPPGAATTIARTLSSPGQAQRRSGDLAGQGRSVDGPGPYRPKPQRVRERREGQLPVALAVRVRRVVAGVLDLDDVARDAEVVKGRG